MGLSLLPCGALPARFPPLPAAVGWAAPVGRLACVGVSRGFVLAVSCCRFRAGRFRGAAFGPLSGRALGRFRPGSVVPPFLPLAVGVCRRRAVPLVRRRVPLCAVLGSACAGVSGFLRGARGARWLRGVGAGLPVLAAVPVGVAFPGACSGRLGCRSRFLWPASAAAAGAGWCVVARAVSSCAAARGRWLCWSVAAPARSGCRRCALGAPVGWCCCPLLARAGLRRFRCAWAPVPPLFPLRSRCRVSRFPFRRAVVPPVLCRVSCPPFLFARGGFFRFFC